MGERLLSQILADDLGLMQQDVIAHVIQRYGRDNDLTPAEIIEVVRGDLDHLCERSVPDYWWGTRERDGLCRCSALGGREHGPGPECPPVLR